HRHRHRLWRRGALSHADRPDPRRSRLRGAQQRLAAAFLRGVRLLRARTLAWSALGLLAALFLCLGTALVWIFANEPGLRRALMPFGLRLGALEIERLRIVRAEAAYSVRKLRFAHLAIGASAPASVSAEGSFELEHERFPLAATLALGGTLERLELRSTLVQAQTQAQVHAVLAPFRAQHIVELEARAAPFDLARLADELPHAALSLEVKASGDERRL